MKLRSNKKLLNNSERGAFKGILMMTSVLTMIGMLVLVTDKISEPKKFYWGIGLIMTGVLVSMFQVMRIDEMLFSNDLVQEARNMLKREKQAQEYWKNTEIVRLPFRERHWGVKLLIVLIWVLGIAATVFGIATAFGFLVPNAVFVARYLHNDPTRVIIDRVMWSVIGIVGGPFMIYIITLIMGSELREKPDNDGWDDIIFVKDSDKTKVH